MMLVELSKDQWRNIVDFIEFNLLDVICRDVICRDVDIDNLKWVESMILAKNEIEKELERENA